MRPFVLAVVAVAVLNAPLLVTLPIQARGEAPEIVTMVQDSEFSPYMTSDVNGASGVYADIIHVADRRLPGYTIDLKATPWSRALHLVREGHVDALVGTYHRPRERPWLGRYSTTIMYENIYVYCHEGVAERNWSYPEDYAGLVFGNNKGFETPGAAFFELVSKGEILLAEEQNTALNLRLLQYGRLDCYVQDEAVVRPILLEKGYDKIVPVRQLTYEAVHVGYSEKWTADVSNAFISALDRVLTEMKKDGTIDEIVFQNAMQ